MKTLICISKDGELCLRPVNPYLATEQYPVANGYVEQPNPSYRDFERTVQIHPINNLAIQPGETIDADKVVLGFAYRDNTKDPEGEYPGFALDEDDIPSWCPYHKAYTALSPKEPQPNVICGQTCLCKNKSDCKFQVDNPAKIKAALSNLQSFGRDPVIYDTTDYREPQQKDVTLLEGGDGKPKYQHSREVPYNVNVEDLLTELLEYMEDRQDVEDGSEESGPQPNKEMRLATDIKQALYQLERNIK